MLRKITPKAVPFQRVAVNDFLVYLYPLKPQQNAVTTSTCQALFSRSQVMMSSARMYDQDLFWFIAKTQTADDYLAEPEGN